MTRYTVTPAMGNMLNPYSIEAESPSHAVIPAARVLFGARAQRWAGSEEKTPTGYAVTISRAGHTYTLSVTPEA
ncbi:hypothetical protein QOL99_03000 [Deinococcus sp. MIMF12]|uniref:Uncharacterized protein n=1 Tax=Deinococcus rhizophilus TaxID=3049544 RepID=A0ABT7JF54_9DEIO|nr:hypothetical protein [Deinococcus rhizophilus]MDL2343113.1 hypothetical protein [Deinococcus rhizophilus]